MKAVFTFPGVFFLTERTTGSIFGGRLVCCGSDLRRINEASDDRTRSYGYKLFKSSDDGVFGASLLKAAAACVSCGLSGGDVVMVVW